jgi:hypothetical protein
MRDMVAVEFVSVDGVTDAPEKWTTLYFDDEVGQAMQSGMDASDARLLGRRTYEDFVAYWPDKTARTTRTPITSTRPRSSWCPRP